MDRGVGGLQSVGPQRVGYVLATEHGPAHTHTHEFDTFDLPDPGTEPVFPAWVGGFFTTEPPGKPLPQH